MPRVALLYFGGCPNIDQARAAIRAAGTTNFVEIDQDELSEAHPYKSYSSPTVLVDGEIIAGSRNGGAACSIIDWRNVSITIAGHVSALHCGTASYRHCELIVSPR